MPHCRCESIRILHDVPADDYSGHLVREGADAGGERVHYRCPLTGRRWVTEFVDDHEGHTSLRLRQLTGEETERAA